MNKISKRPATILAPVPAAMVSCGTNPENYNIITIAWTGTICSSPPMCYVSIRPERHSYEIIKKSKEFVINSTNEKLIKAMDWCGVYSGKDFDKFKETKLTPGKCQIVKAPLIVESPVNIECEVKNILPLGSHDIFIAEVVAVNMDEGYSFNEDLITYNNGQYYTLGKNVGYYGFVKK